MIPNTAEETAAIFKENDPLEKIEVLDQEFLDHFKEKFLIEPALNRTLVSFQANKNRPIYRWYKYKEAFSANLVDYLFHRYEVLRGKVLDPFAGSGTSLFATSATGLDADGIELLPIGQQIIKTRQILELNCIVQNFVALNRWILTRPWKEAATDFLLPEKL